MINASPDNTYISRRPAWASEVTLDQDCINYYWTAPTQAVDAPDCDPLNKTPYPPCRVTVQLVQEDFLDKDDQGVRVTRGQERIFLLDTNLDIENARKLAAAILECCDRITGS